MKRMVWVAVVLLAAAVPAAGQTTFGPQLSWGDDTDLGIGARVEVPLADFVVAPGESAVNDLTIIGSFDWFFPDEPAGVDLSYWELNANLAYAIPVEGLRPYVGGGLNIARGSFETAEFDDSDTEVGLNLLGGLKFLLGTVDAFTEARFELGGGEQFVLTAGVLFGL